MRSRTTAKEKTINRTAGRHGMLHEDHWYWGTCWRYVEPTCCVVLAYYPCTCSRPADVTAYNSACIGSGCSGRPQVKYKV